MLPVLTLNGQTAFILFFPPAALLLAVLLLSRLLLFTVLRLPPYLLF